MTDVQHDRVVDLVILLKSDEITKKKMPVAPSKEVLDKLQKFATDQFVAYQARISKIPA